MSEKYKNKYRIKSARLPNWDYGSNGMYFITICTQNREHYFGDIINGKMQLNEIGKIVKNEWVKTFEMRPDMNLQMGEFVIMPNHFHAIIIIGDNEYNTQRDTQRTQRRDAMHCVSTPATANTTANTNTNVTKNKFGPQSKNLASIVRGFKIGVTKNARKIHADFGWQSRFHDHIIRNEKSFKNISNYIINNPMNWNEDKFYKKEINEK
jgi:REP element-mobilizing transposase RayT